MPKLSEPLLRVVCALLAVVLLFQIVRLVIRNNPMDRLKVPELPTLTVAADASGDKKGTNAFLGTAAGKMTTNAVAAQKSAINDTNSARAKSAPGTDTNSIAGKSSEKIGTNAASAEATEKSSTNVVASQAGKVETNASTTVAAGKPDTNTVVAKGSGTNSTNSVSSLIAGKSGTNSNPRLMAGRGGPGFGPGQPPKPPELPPIIQARVDKIMLSELLAPVMHPLPMGLLGIAGDKAFLRSPSGQTGMVKEGGELGGMKLLEIGINRVLVEQEGQKKELMIFSGYGGESLLPKLKETTNEITPIHK